MTPHPAATAGASARVHHDRRSTARGDVVRRARPPILLAAGIGVAVGLSMVLLGPTWAPVGLALAAAATVAVVSTLVGRRTHGRTSATGAEVERRTAEALADLESDGYRVLHHRRIPGSRAAVDIVIGRTGVFLLDTTSLSGALRVKNGEVGVAGRRHGVLDQLGREVDAIAVALPGTQVTPVACVDRAHLPGHPLEVDGVRVVDPGALVARIAEGPTRLDLLDIRRLATRLDARLTRAA